MHGMERITLRDSFFTVCLRKQTLLGDHFNSIKFGSGDMFNSVSDLCPKGARFKFRSGHRLS